MWVTATYLSIQHANANLKRFDNTVVVFSVNKEHFNKARNRDLGLTNFSSFLPVPVPVSDDLSSLL